MIIIHNRISWHTPTTWSAYQTTPHQDEVIVLKIILIEELGDSLTCLISHLTLSNFWPSKCLITLFKFVVWFNLLYHELYQYRGFLCFANYPMLMDQQKHVKYFDIYCNNQLCVGMITKNWKWKIKRTQANLLVAKMDKFFIRTSESEILGFDKLGWGRIGSQKLAGFSFL